MGPGAREDPRGRRGAGQDGFRPVQDQRDAVVRLPAAGTQWRRRARARRPDRFRSDAGRREGAADQDVVAALRPRRQLRQGRADGPAVPEVRAGRQGHAAAGRQRVLPAEGLQGRHRRGRAPHEGRRHAERGPAAVGAALELRAERHGRHGARARAAAQILPFGRHLGARARRLPQADEARPRADGAVPPRGRRGRSQGTGPVHRHDAGTRDRRLRPGGRARHEEGHRRGSVHRRRAHARQAHARSGQAQGRPGASCAAQGGGAARGGQVRRRDREDRRAVFQRR